MDSDAICEEREVLDHQRIRIEEILANKIVSPEMARDLRRPGSAIGAGQAGSDSFPGVFPREPHEMYG